ncbi:MAG: SRPBCC family protein [Ilumatobacteraceae bacterium]
MARYTTTIRTERSVEDAFDYMSDMRNFTSWDPGTKRAVQKVGDGPGIGAEYELTAKGPGRDLVLPYSVIEFTPHSGFLARAETKTLTSDDRISVRTDGEATLVTYDADLQLKGWLKIADLGLRLVFKRIGDKAAEGLAEALDGRIVS